MVQSGRVHVFSSNDKHKVNLARLGPGEIFGEIALLSDEPRAASVEAAEDCNPIVVSREAFKEKLGNSDPTVQAMLKMLAGGIIESNNAVIRSIRDLEETFQVKFNNVLEQLPEEKKKNFRKAVLPEINALLGALQNFREDSELGASPNRPGVKPDRRPCVGWLQARHAQRNHDNISEMREIVRFLVKADSPPELALADIKLVMCGDHGFHTIDSPVDEKVYKCQPPELGYEHKHDDQNAQAVNTGVYSQRLVAGHAGIAFVHRHPACLKQEIACKLFQPKGDI